VGNDRNSNPAARLCLLNNFQFIHTDGLGDFLDFIQEKADDTRLSGLRLVNK
jgi:hypothetical protein